MASIGSLVIDLLAKTGTFETDMGRAAKVAEKRALDIDRSVSRIGKAVALAGVAAVSGFAVMVRSSINAADQLNKLSQSVGISTETLSQLGYAAKLSDVDLESLTKGLGRLSRNAVDAARGMAGPKRAFDALGISVKKSDGTLKDSDQLLLDVADRFSGLEDGAGKAALAQELFGRSGLSLIPLLNQGSEGIRRATEEADKFGVTVGTKAAQAAEDFNDNLTRLGTAAKGVANQAAQRLLPALVGITDQFVAFAKDGEKVTGAVDKIEAAFKAVITVAVIFGSVLNAVGTAIGNLAGAAGELTKGLKLSDFASPATLLFKIGKNAASAGDTFANLGEGFSGISEQIGKDLKFIDGLWNGFDETLEEVDVTAKKVKSSLKFDDAGVSKAVNSAIKTLTEFKQGLLEQVATFGLGEAAAIKYRLEFGNLADEVKKAGEAGEALKGGILAAANFKQAQEDTKALGEAIADINIQLDELAGKNVESVLGAFDKQNAELRKTIERSGTQADKDKLAALRTQIGAQAEFNQLQKEAAAITEDLTRQEERIRNSQETGATTELDAMLQLDDARKGALAQLDKIRIAQQLIAEESGNPALIENAKKFGAEIERLATQTDLLAQRLRSGFEEAGTDAFADFISGAKSAGDALTSFLNDVERQITQLVAKQLIQKLFSGLGGESGSGGVFGAIAGLFGGGKAYGGDVNAGTVYRVNEREPEYFRPNVSGKVIPLSKMAGGGGGGNTFAPVFNVRGDITRRSAQQLAIDTARRQRIHSSRLG